MKDNRAEWILERVETIIDRWDKDEYTADSLPMRGLIANLRLAVKEEKGEDSLPV